MMKEATAFRARGRDPLLSMVGKPSLWWIVGSNSVNDVRQSVRSGLLGCMWLGTKSGLEARVISNGKP